MKKHFNALIVAMVAVVAVAGDILSPGVTGSLTDGGIIKGVALASTNASQTATVKAVYKWPVYGTVSRQEIETRVRKEWCSVVEVLTNWCDYATDTSITNISGSVTNVVYYDGITVTTNMDLRPVIEVVTNTVTSKEVTGYTSKTNSLYSLTATNGFTSSTDRKLVGAGAELSVEGAPVTIFWEK